MANLIPATINDRLRLKKVIQALSKFLKDSDRIVQLQTKYDFERYIDASFKRIFDKQGESVIRQLNAGTDIDTALNNALKLTEKESVSVILTVWRVMIAYAIDKFPKQFLESEQVEHEGIPESFRLDNPKAMQRLRAVAAERITKINQVTKERIKEIIVEAKDKGYSSDKLSKSIQDEFAQMSIGKPQLHIQSRAHLIAVTETAEAYGYANKFSADEIQDEINMPMEKFWQTQEDDRVSEGCQENQDAGWIDLNELFPSGHDREPRFPGCRCTVLYRVAGAE